MFVLYAELNKQRTTPGTVRSWSVNAHVVIGSVLVIMPTVAVQSPQRPLSQTLTVILTLRDGGLECLVQFFVWVFQEVAQGQKIAAGNFVPKW